MSEAQLQFFMKFDSKKIDPDHISYNDFLENEPVDDGRDFLRIDFIDELTTHVTVSRWILKSKLAYVDVVGCEIKQSP